MGVCHAFLALGQTIFASIVQFGQSVVKLGEDCYAIQSVVSMLKTGVY